MLDNVAGDPTFIKRITTGNETWFMNMLSKLSNNLAIGAPEISRNIENQSSLKTLKTIPTKTYNKSMENWFLSKNLRVKATIQLK